jgi:hypothetical protein
MNSETPSMPNLRGEIAASCHAVEGPFRDPELRDGETSVYRGSIRGVVAGAGTLRIEAAPDAYLQRIEMRLRDTLTYTLELRAGSATSECCIGAAS